MLDTIKDLVSRYKVQVMLVGGAIVVATTWGTCTFEPNEEASDAAEEVDAAPVSNSETTTEQGVTTTEEVTTTEAAATEAEAVDAVE